MAQRTDVAAQIAELRPERAERQDLVDAATPTVIATTTPAITVREGAEKLPLN